MASFDAFSFKDEFTASCWFLIIEGFIILYLSSIFFIYLEPGLKVDLASAKFCSIKDNSSSNFGSTSEIINPPDNSSINPLVDNVPSLMPFFMDNN